MHLLPWTCRNETTQNRSHVLGVDMRAISWCIYVQWINSAGSARTALWSYTLGTKDSYMDHWLIEARTSTWTTNVRSMDHQLGHRFRLEAPPIGPLNAPSKRGACASDEDKIPRQNSAPTPYRRTNIVVKLVVPSVAPVGDLVCGVLAHRFDGLRSGTVWTSPQPQTPTKHSWHTHVSSPLFVQLSFLCLRLSVCVTPSSSVCLCRSLSGKRGPVALYI